MESYYLELGGVENGFFKRNTYIPIDDSFEEELEKYANKLKNTDVYHSVYRYESQSINDCLLYAPVYFDMDMEINEDKDFQKIVKDTLLVVSFLKEEFGIPEDLIEIYFSGSKGFHILVPPEVFGIEPRKNLNIELKRIAEEANKVTLHGTVDMKIYDRRRLFRFPNTINGKTGLYKVPVSMKNLRQMDFDEIQEYAKEPKPLPEERPRLIEKAMKKYKGIMLVAKSREALSKRKPKGMIMIPESKKDLLPCVKETLQCGVGKGGRNGTSVALASSLIQSGYKEDEVTELMLGWNENNEPPLPERELMTTIRSAHSLVGSGRGYGCTFFKDQGLCVGNTCPLFGR